MAKKTIQTLSALSEQNLIASADEPLLQQVIDDFSLAITEQMYQQINKQDPNDPVAKQFVPSIDELAVMPLENRDPIGDNVHSKVKGIIHRYPDRCLFMPVHVCPVYCRFCFRKEKVGEGSATLNPGEMAKAYAYLEENKTIWEVIITGGDPLILKPAMLQKIIRRLSEIDHVEVIRLHTRVPVVDSKRITAEMIAAIKCNKAVYIVLHANHVNEFTPEAITVCAALIDAGIPMLSQSVLLKGVNDNIEALSALMRCFVKNRIKPYYLHHCDLARGTSHFRTSVEVGQRLMQELRGRYSGLCQPTYILDIPGGYGKVPIGPQYLEGGTIRDYQDNCHQYDID